MAVEHDRPLMGDARGADVREPLSGLEYLRFTAQDGVATVVINRPRSTQCG